ncbi:kelch repeat-containing protein [Gemmatimonas sp.]|uniref:kelch repeat-containing protein n=1 Tax=Gemmatimonas sp. TaxID=1962908 RepID=UPI003F71640F
MSIRTVRVALFAGLLLPWGARSSPTEASVIPTASLSVERMAHTATMLASGEVLVAGGFADVQRAARSAELYSPALRRFAPLPRMLVLRHSHTATLLADGSVLIAGGYATSGDPVVEVERFDPVRRRFEPAGRMLDARAGDTAQLLRRPDNSS